MHILSSARLLTLSSLLTLAALSHAVSFQNGSLEMGTDPGGFTNLSTGSTAITGWTVDSGNVDYIGSYWTASDGSRSVDLSGSSVGSISQTFDTIVGKSYSVLFDMAGNPAGDPMVKTMGVSAANAAQTYTFDTTGRSTANMGWKTMSFGFTANSASTTLRFASLNNTLYGPALDNVRVQATPEPASLAALGVGALGLLRRRRKA